MAELCPRFIVKLTVCDLETNRFVATLGITGFPQFRVENVSAKLVSTGRQHHSLKGERKGLALTPSASPSHPPQIRAQVRWVVSLFGCDYPIYMFVLYLSLLTKFGE